MSFSLLLTSKDKRLMKSVETISQRLKLNYNLQPIIEAAILTTLEEDINLFLYDMCDYTENHFDTLKVIKRLNPALPIIVLTEDNSIETLQRLAQLKIYYIILKPVQNGELQKVIHALQENATKN